MPPFWIVSPERAGSQSPSLRPHKDRHSISVCLGNYFNPKIGPKWQTPGQGDSCAGSFCSSSKHSGTSEWPRRNPSQRGAMVFINWSTQQRLLKLAVGGGREEAWLAHIPSSACVINPMLSQVLWTLFSSSSSFPLLLPPPPPSSPSPLLLLLSIEV